MLCYETELAKMDAKYETKRVCYIVAIYRPSRTTSTWLKALDHTRHPVNVK